MIAAFSLALLSAVPALANHTPKHAKSELALKPQCNKLTPVAATKNTKGVAYNKAHPDVMQADGAMMAHDDAMSTKKDDSSSPAASPQEGPIRTMPEKTES